MKLTDDNKIWGIVFTSTGFYDESEPKFMLSWGVFKTYESAVKEALRRFEGERAMCYHVGESRILDGLMEFEGDGVLYRYEVVWIEVRE